MAAAAELILGAMLPVFAYVYADADYKLLATTKLPSGTNGLEALKLLDASKGVPIWKVYLLASLPVLIIGLVNIFFVPLAISIGRRPVILASGLIAIGGAVWAGHSTSLDSHIAARCIQAVGAGTVESLLPFIIQDMTFYHQRNLAISTVFVSQGMIIVGLGIAAPYIIINLNWQWVYFITAIAAGVFWIGVFVTLPETRFNRSQAEMSKLQCGTGRKKSY
jgi:MFS family permease